MQNDRQAEPPPDTKFEACQPEAGTVLLFFIYRGIMFMAKDAPWLAHGWWREDLSSAWIGRDLPGGICTDFTSALSVPAPGRAQKLHLALVVNDGASDQLYLSLGNHAAEWLWNAAPAWVACPFDARLGAADARPPSLTITKVHIGDANDHQFIAVEALVAAAGARPRRARYIIDLRDTQDNDAGPIGPRWVEHKLPIDSDTGVNLSCIGRCRGGWDVDGLYLAGRLEGDAQLVYAPLYNPFNRAQPRWSRRLEIPGKLAVDTIAPCRHADNTTDLYATANGALYYFSAANQNEGAQALLLVTAPEFDGMRSLFAATLGDRVTVWGLNHACQVIHTSAPQVRVADPDAWSAPSVVLVNVDAITPCPDRDALEDAFFAHTAGGLVKVTRPPTDHYWFSYDVVLPLQDA